MKKLADISTFESLTQNQVVGGVNSVFNAYIPHGRRIVKNKKLPKGEKVLSSPIITREMKVKKRWLDFFCMILACIQKDN